MTHGDDNFITTITGRKFWPLDPRPDDICIEDIAHALSLICRFNGHVRTFYSVAQHSLIVSRYLPDEIAMFGLLHDAAEAYIGDMSGPLKHTSDMTTFRECDHRLTQMIYGRFGLSQAEPAHVKAIDRYLICDEARELTPKLARPGVLQGPGLGIRISPMCPEEAKHAFLFRFHQLHGVRGGRHGMKNATRAQIAAAFTEWDRRYRENPEKFKSEAQHLLKDTPETYGEACAPYFESILAEIQSRS